MTSSIILLTIGIYFILLLSIGYFTSRNSNSDSYFLGNKQSLWWLVAIGMLSDSMSGVTFISVPGDVFNTKFYYMQMVIGYLFGYLIIAFVLLPLYYKLNLTSIYSYLGSRFGFFGQKVGASYFVLSRLIGSAARLFLTASILQLYLFSAWGFPFWATVSIIIILILLYTLKGGIKTLVITDAFQSLVLLGGLLTCVIILVSKTDIGYLKILSTSNYTTWFNWDFTAKTYFWKHVLGGAFICITMTGLDQNMMQKNLSCRSISDAKKNILSYGAIVFVVNMIFLSLGVVMIYYAQQQGIDLPMKNGKIYTDGIFPFLALNKLGLVAGVAFILGLAAATFSSADSVLTTLTTSSYIDLLNLENAKISEAKKLKYRNILHAGFAVLLLFTILIFEKVHQDSLISMVLKIANFTYGPLLGLFAFGILTKTKVKGWGILVVSLLSPIITYFISEIPPASLNDYQFGFELLIINGSITFLGLWITSLFQAKKAI